MANEIENDDLPPFAAPPESKPRGKSVGRSDILRSETGRDDAPRRQRLVRGGVHPDKYYIDPARIPDGMSYEWKRHTVNNQTDPGYDSFIRGQGWEPVPSERHPELAAPGEVGPVIRGGLILCERPMYMTKEAMDESQSEAANTVVQKFRQLGEAPPGTLPRDNGKAGSLAEVNIGYGGMDIPN